MFNVTGSEIFILLVLALVVVGPERLPDVIRKFGKTYGELRKMSTGFQSELRDALDEPMREMRATADQIRKTIEEPINDTIKTGQDAVKGGLAAGDATPAAATSSDAAAGAGTAATPSAAEIDPINAAEATDPAPAAAATTGSGVSAAGSVEATTRPSSPFDRAVSSSAAPLVPKNERVAANAGDLPLPSGPAFLPPPSPTAPAFLPPPLPGDAADPAHAPERPTR